MVFVLYLAIAISAYGQVTGNTVTVIPKGDGSATGELRLRELNANGQNYVGLRAPDAISGTPGNLIWKLPNADAVGALCSDGSLNLSFGCSAALPVPQSTAIVIGVTDPTKVLKFDVDSSLTTGATRTLTVPDESTTIVGTENHRYGTPFILQTWRANGDATTPTAVNNGDLLFRIYGWMRGASAYESAGDIRYMKSTNGTQIVFSNSIGGAFGGSIVMDDDGGFKPYSVGTQNLGSAISYWDGVYAKSANLSAASAVVFTRATRTSTQNMLWNVSGGGNGSWLFGAGPAWDFPANSGMHLYHNGSAVLRINETGDSTQLGSITVGASVLSGGSGSIGSTGTRWGNGFFNSLTLTATAGLGFASDVVPNTNGARDLGNSSYRWRKLYTQDIDANGSGTFSGIVSGPIYPAVTMTHPIGSSSLIWIAGWFYQLNATGTLTLGTSSGQGVASDLIPTSAGLRDMGNSSQYWRDINFSGVLRPQGGSTTLGSNTNRFSNIFSNLITLSTGASQGIGSHAVPATTALYDLGSSSQRWRKLWVGDIDISGTCTGCGGSGGGLLPNMVSLGDYSTASTCGADVSGDMNTAISDLAALGGGTLLVPAGQWCFDSTVVVALNRIMIQGVSTSGNNAPSASKLAWRSAPGSASPLIQFQATKGGGMKDITLQGRGLANTRLLRLVNASYGFYENVQGEQWTSGPGLSLTTDSVIGGFTDEFACHNTFTHVYFTNVSDTANASGLMLDGSDHEDRPGSPQPGSACSNTFIGGRFDYSKAATLSVNYGVKLKAADNNMFLRTNIWASGNDHASTRPAVWWVQHSDASFPKENNMMGVTLGIQNGFYAMQGTAGTGGNYVQLNTDDCGGPTACTPNVDGVVGRTNISLFGTSNFPTKISQAATTTADMLVFDQFSGSYNGAGAMRWDRQGTTYYRLYTNVFDGMTWATRPLAGSLVDRWVMTGDGDWRPAVNVGVDIGDSSHHVNTIHVPNISSSADINFQAGGAGTVMTLTSTALTAPSITGTTINATGNPAYRVFGQTFVDSSRNVTAGNIYPISGSTYALGDPSNPWSSLVANQVTVVNSGVTRFNAGGTINLYNAGGGTVFTVNTSGSVSANGSVSGAGFISYGVSGLTTTVTVPCGTLTFTGGILTSKGACP